MKHLTVDEMIDFVSFNKLDSESLALASKVNAHIFECRACRKKVESFQVVYDEFVGSGKTENLVFEIKSKLKEAEETDCAKKLFEETAL